LPSFIAVSYFAATWTTNGGGRDGWLPCVVLSALKLGNRLELGKG